MAVGGRSEHAGSFGEVAGDYAAARPTYPVEAVDWLTGPPPRDVVDLGAGTGKLTEVLVATGHHVTAVDPSPGMLDELRQRLPGVVTLQGPAEHLPLPDRAYDVVTVAQAWHWFKPVEAARECARVLRPGGSLSLVWNDRDESTGWVGAAWAPLRRTGGVGMSLLPDGWQDAIPAAAPFEPVQTAVFSHTQRISRSGVLQLVCSRSTVALMTPEQRAELLAEVAATLDEHPDSRGRDTLTMAYETRCYRWARRR